MTRPTALADQLTWSSVPLWEVTVTGSCGRRRIYTVSATTERGAEELAIAQFEDEIANLGEETA